MKMFESTTVRKAFTLLEIIIALVMLVLILGSAYGTYAAAMRSVAHLQKRHALQQQAGIFLQRIASEIRCCYAGYEDKSSQYTLETIRTGQERQHQSRASLFTGREASSGRSFLRFVTSAVASKREHNLGGLAIIEYMLDSSKNTLLRSKRRYLDGFEVNKDDYDWVVILENVQTITIEYFDGEEWLKEWDSNDTAGSLPHAVGISLVMKNEAAGPLSFESKVQIVCRTRQTGGMADQKTAESDKILQGISNNKTEDD